MGYIVKVEHNRSKLQHITVLANNDELGNFLLHLNKDYEIREIEKTNYDVIKDSSEFIEKEKNIEYGNNKKEEE